MAELARPTLAGIQSGEVLWVQWPPPGPMLAAVLAPNVMVTALLAEAARMSGDPVKRQERMAALQRELREAYYAEEALLGDNERSGRAPAWVVLGCEIVASG